jgi:vancomycin aglycone glucosyltransferase
MRVLLSTIGSRGDVQPLVALASQLRQLGHEARLCVPPDFEEWIERLGFPVTPIGPSVRRHATASPPVTPLPPEQLQQMIAATVATQFATISTASRDCDIIVAATALQFAARSIARKMRVPYVFVAYSPVVLPSPHHAPPPLPPLPGPPAPPPATGNEELWARDAERFNSQFGTAVNAHRAAIGLPPVMDIRAHMFAEQPWLAADPTLAPWLPTPGMDVFQTGAWILPDDRPLEPDVERFLQPDDAPVYFGFGSSAAPGEAAVMLDAARAAGRRVIVSRGWMEPGGGVDAPDLLEIGEANLSVLFRRVAAVVHHGGAGTTTAAARAGVPQVIVPMRYDQHYFARRIGELGIGVAHPVGTPTAESFAHALQQVMHPGVRARAATIGTSVQDDGVAVAARRLIALIEDVQRH